MILEVKLFDTADFPHNKIKEIDMETVNVVGGFFSTKMGKHVHICSLKVLCLGGETKDHRFARLSDISWNRKECMVGGKDEDLILLRRLSKTTVKTNTRLYTWEINLYAERQGYEYFPVVHKVIIPVYSRREKRIVRDVTLYFAPRSRRKHMWIRVVNDPDLAEFSS